jgi:gluconokinase
MIVVVMGVSGSGKTSVGRALSERLGWAFIEGDELHTEANRRKMASGTPLDDADRWPWLARIAEAAGRAEAAGNSVVIACSALKRAYRDRLREAGDDVRFIHLTGDPEIIRARLSARVDHYMPAGLLQSQIAALEQPDPDEMAVAFDIREDAAAIAARAAAALEADGAGR